METLLIGGHNDGGRVAINNDRPHLRMRVPSGCDVTQTSTMLTTEDYRAEYFRFCDANRQPKEIKVFVHTSMNIIEAMERLIQNYKPKS